MAVYSYNANQLRKKTEPKKPFWTRNKIIVAAGSLSVFSFGVLVANAPAPSVTEAAPVSQPIVKAEPVKKIDTNLSQYIREDSSGYTCINQQNGKELFTSNYQSCVSHVTSYHCAIDENWFIDTANKVECDRKQKEQIAKKNAEFDVNSFAQDYKNALDVLETKTRK